MCRYCTRLKDQLLILRQAARFENLPEDENDRNICLPKDACERIKQALRDLSPKSP